MKIEFEGIPSGDYESFCWDVDYDTYIIIKRQYYLEDGFTHNEINKMIDMDIKYDESCFNEGLYRIYPNCFFKRSNDKHIQKVIIEIEQLIERKQ